MTSSSAVWITGLGVVSAVGHSAQDFWAALSAGRTGVAHDVGARRVVAEVHDFDARAWISAASLRRMDRLSRMMVAAGAMALADAGLAPGRDVAPERVGLALGTSLGNISETVDFLARIKDRGPGLASPLVFPNLVLNAPASYASIELQVTGPSISVSQGDVSGELAVATGYDLVASGIADVVLAGGGEELAPITAAVYRDIGLACRDPRAWRGPFDAAPGGAAPGEGAAILVLEEARHARARGRAGYAEMAGHRSWSTAAPLYGWSRDGTRVAVEIRRLLERGTGKIDAAYLGAPGVRERDRIELVAVSEALRGGGGASIPWVSSIKGAIGEFGAAGALSLAAAALSVARGAVLPIVGVERPIQADGVRLAVGEARPGRLQEALVTGFARGGLGAAVLLRRAPGALGG
jgi:3-oxoacyl-[acyl-carrier-protein] synthase II